MLTPGPLTIFRRAAMASDFEVALNESQDEFGADAALNALDEIERVEEALSVFRPTSVASRLNLLAADIPVRVDEEMWTWLEEALRIGKETEGAFDIASAPLWRAWGFADRDGEFPPKEKLQDALNLSGARHLRLNYESNSVSFDAPGVELNFGAIGKGIALDLAAKKLDASGITDYLIQGGKSGVVARGGRLGDFSNVALRDQTDVAQEIDEDEEYDEESGFRKRNAISDKEALENALPDILKPDDQLAREARLADAPIGWTIGVAHPLAPEKRLGTLWLRDRALATSGTTYQFFRAGGKRYSHIIDPRTGYPTTGTLSTTVLAPTATEADALSTAFFVLGPAKTQEFCRRRPDVAALLVLERETAPGYELATFNMSPDVFAPC